MVDDLPEPVLGLVGFADRGLLGFQEPVHGHERGVGGVVFGVGHVHFVDGVVGPVDFEVHADVEHVLVDRGVEAVVVQGLAVRALLPGLLAGGGEDAGGLDQELDGPVQEQVPVEGVFVVRDRGDEGDHELAVAAGLGGPSRKSKCFHRIESSSSCMQIAFSIVHGLPRESTE